MTFYPFTARCPACDDMTAELLDHAPTYVCARCGAYWRYCDVCDGTGEIHEDQTRECPGCLGDGLVLAYYPKEEAE